MGGPDRGVIMAGMEKKSPNIGMVMDTSGSMDPYMRGLGLGLIDTVLKGSGMTPVLWFIPTDSRAAKPLKVKSAKEAQKYMTGGGGTDMGAGLDAAAALRPKAAVFVVTDGDTGWPAKKPEGLVGKVVILITPRKDGSFSAQGVADAKALDWAEVVVARTGANRKNR